MSNIVKCCVRKNHLGNLELFYYDGNQLCCYSNEEMHNDCCLQYMYHCKLVDDNTAQIFIDEYNNRYSYLDYNPTYVSSKRLNRGMNK